jgi:O-antigen ligase
VREFVLFILLFFGLGYILNPPVWTGAFFMALLYFGQDFTLRQGLVGGGGLDIQSVFKGLLAALLLGYGLFNGLSRVPKHPVLLLLLAYTVFAAFTASYSSAKALGVGSGIALLGIALGTARAGSMSTSDLGTYWRFLYGSAVLMCMLSFLLLGVFPGLALDLADPGAFRVKGVTGSANSLGPILTVGLIIGISVYRLAETRARKNLHIFFCLVMLAGLVLTNSRSSLIGLVIGLVAALFIGRKQSVMTLLFALVGAMVGAMIVVFPSILKTLVGWFADLFARSGSVHEITSFTGRKEIWEACIKLIADKPWFGYGLGSVRVEIPKVFHDMWGNSAATAHNFILESMISVGLFGTILLVLVLLIPTVGLIRFMSGRDDTFQNPQQREWTMCALRCMLMLWIHSVVERAFAGTAAPSTVVLGLCVASYVHVSLHMRALKNARVQRIRNLR